MTLRFFTQFGKPDTRKIEYEQGIVRLGLEKTEVEREVERARVELASIEKQRDETLADVRELEKIAKSYDDRRVEIQKEISLALKNAGEESFAMKEKLNRSESKIDDKKSKLEELNAHLLDLDTEMENKRQKLVSLQKKATDARAELAPLLSKLSAVKLEIANAEEDVQKVYRLKKDAVEKTEIARKELVEIEAQIATLKKDNHGGLDAIASLEAERTRIKAREKGLDDKAADLKVYENRLIKEAKKLGVDLKMSFTE